LLAMHCVEPPVPLPPVFARPPVFVVPPVLVLPPVPVLPPVLSGAQASPETWKPALQLKPQAVPLHASLPFSGSVPGQGVQLVRSQPKPGKGVVQPPLQYFSVDLQSAAVWPPLPDEVPPVVVVPPLEPVVPPVVPPLAFDPPVALLPPLVLVVPPPLSDEPPSPVDPPFDVEPPPPLWVAPPVSGSTPPSTPVIAPETASTSSPVAQPYMAIAMREGHRNRYLMRKCWGLL